MKAGRDFSMRVFLAGLYLILFICGWGSAEDGGIAGVEHVEVFSGGFLHGNDVVIRVGDHTFYEGISDGTATAGLYVVGIYQNEVLLQSFYHTYQLIGASEGLYRDISVLPAGTLVIAAAKDEPTKCFETRGQEALLQIGAGTGLLGQSYRTAYLCVGVKGMASGEAIEQVGLEDQHYVGGEAGEPLELIFPAIPDPAVSLEPGLHEGLIINQTEVLYYIPQHFDPESADYFVGIHGAGDWHRPGAMNRIAQFRELADMENLVLIAPAFDAILNWQPVWPDDFDDEGNFSDPRIVKNKYIWDFVGLLSHWHSDRADRRLLEIMEFFNRKLMDREKFYLYGHSGGGQFASRFATLYADRLYSPVVLGSPGSYAFPRRDVDFPFGIKMDNLKGTFGNQTEAEDLNLSESQMNVRMNSYLDLKVYILAGELETEAGSAGEEWQGANTLERAWNYYLAMMEEHILQIQMGNRVPSDPYRFQLRIQEGVGHDSNANAKAGIALMFPRSTGDMNRDGIVNLCDLTLLAQSWRNAELFLPVDIAPLPYGDGVVDFDDMEIMIENWLE